jgi:hypothetical protein
LFRQAAAAQAHKYEAKERIYTPLRSFTGPDSPDAAVFSWLLSQTRNITGGNRQLLSGQTENTELTVFYNNAASKTRFLGVAMAKPLGTVMANRDYVDLGAAFHFLAANHAR